MWPRPSIVLACALAVGVVACRAPTYEAEGDLVAVDADGATIAHEKIPDLMDAMTMRFPARPASILTGARPGTRVRFELRRDGDALILVRLTPIGMATGTTPGTHDHRPLHGGVVSMLGLIHVEVAATPDGRVRAYLSDLWRRDLPVTGTSGTVRLNLPDGPRTLTFGDVGEALEARTSPFVSESALANVALTRQGQPLQMNVLLDLTGNRAGLSIVPQTGCIAPSRVGDGNRAPRCVVTFVRTFSALATTPDGTRAVVAIAHGATSVWRLPDATLEMGVDPPPPIPVLPGAHEPDPRAIAFGPGAAEMVVAIGARLSFSDAATGRFRRQLEGPGGMIQALAWSPGGGALVVATGDGTARVLDPGDGRVLRTLAMENQVLVVAVDAAGRWAGLGNDVGAIGIVDLSGDGAPRVATPSLQPVEALAFAGDRLVSAGSDGTLRAFDPATGRETDRFSVGTPLVALAISPDGRHAATADNAHELRIHHLPDGVIVDRLAWHRATIGVLAWGAGGTLVAGDNDGELAVWDVPAAR
jgi:Cu/Ag efflux protein CusF/outer membrane protein assembly factor BamB